MYRMHFVDYKTQLVQERILNASIYQKVATLSGELIYLLAPHTPSQQMGTTKFCQGYVGPLVIHTMLEAIHYKMRDMEKRLPLDRFNINRVKLAFVSTPVGTVNTQQQLTEAVKGTNAT